MNYTLDNMIDEYLRASNNYLLLNNIITILSSIEIVSDLNDDYSELDNITELEKDILNIITNDESEYRDGIIDDIHQVVIEYTQRYLRTLGINIKYGNLVFYKNIISSYVIILTIDNSYKIFINNTIENDETDNVEKLYILLSEFIELNYSEFMQQVIDVDDDVLDTINKFKDDEVEIEDLSIVREIIKYDQSYLKTSVIKRVFKDGEILTSVDGYLSDMYNGVNSTLDINDMIKEVTIAFFIPVDTRCKFLDYLSTHLHFDMFNNIDGQEDIDAIITGVNKETNRLCSLIGVENDTE